MMHIKPGALPSSSTQGSLHRLLAKTTDIQQSEFAPVVAAFFLFFFMWAGYFAVRPVRETIGTLLGREQVADLWVVTALFSILIIPIYGWIVGKIRRSVFLPAVYAVVAVLLAMIGLQMHGGTGVSPWVGKCFYVFISVINLFLISMFWSSLLEIFDTGQSKRLFGFIAAGGSAGALSGPLISDQAVGSIGNSGILFLGAAFFVIAIVCQRTLLGIWAAQPPTELDSHLRATERSGQSGPERDRPIGGKIFAGVTDILRSPYLLGIAVFVVFISTVNTLLYFEQLHVVKLAYPDPTDRTRIFARIDWIVQTLTVLSQILLTGRIARRFGVKSLLTWVPIAMVVGFLSIAASGSFLVFAVVLVLRRACEYAFIRPGREMLWSPLNKETKYKAKGTVDVPVYRGADALSAQVNNAVVSAGAGTAGVALLGAAVALAWGALGYWLGRRYDRLTRREGAMAG